MPSGRTWRERRDDLIVGLAARYVYLRATWQLLFHDRAALRKFHRAKRAARTLRRLDAWLDVDQLDREPPPERFRLICEAAHSASQWPAAEEAMRATTRALPTYRERVRFAAALERHTARTGQPLPQTYGWELVRGIDRAEAARDLDALLAGPERSIVLDHVGSLTGIAGIEERRRDGRLSDEEADDLLRFMQPP